MPPGERAAAILRPVVMPARTADAVGDVVGSMRRGGYPDKFINENFRVPEEALEASEVLVAFVPSRSRKSTTGLRAVGALRRSLMKYSDDERAGESFVWINYIYVLPEFRRKHVGSALLAAALWYSDDVKRDVRLWPSDAKDETEADNLRHNFYEKLGFLWDEEEEEMVIEKARLPAPSPPKHAVATWWMGVDRKDKPRLHANWGLVPARSRSHQRPERASC